MQASSSLIPSVCIRAPHHDGPCNGYPRPDCLTLVTLAGRLHDWVSDLVDDATQFIDPAGILSYGARVAMVPGLVCEFGVFQGNSIRYLASVVPHLTIHGFDSFRGLPEEGPRKDGSWFAGRFNLEGQIPEVPQNVKLYPGLFEDTLPPFLEAHPEPASFIHVDCDIYSSTKTVLNSLWSRIQVGTVFKFDEFWGFEGWEESSEAKAMYELCQESGMRVECLGTCVEMALLRVY